MKSSLSLPSAAACLRLDAATQQPQWTIVWKLRIELKIYH